jgi:hypothetical protein
LILEHTEAKGVPTMSIMPDERSNTSIISIPAFIPVEDTLKDSLESDICTRYTHHSRDEDAIVFSLIKHNDLK